MFHVIYNFTNGARKQSSGKRAVSCLLWHLFPNLRQQICVYAYLQQNAFVSGLKKWHWFKSDPSAASSMKNFGLIMVSGKT